jgi:hypothetical protein
MLFARFAIFSAIAQSLLFSWARENPAHPRMQCAAAPGSRVGEFGRF